MAKEDKPFEYQRRLRDTKGVAQRLDLDYLKRPAILGLFRKRLTWALVAAAVLACVPLVMGVGGSRGAAAAGPLSQAHALYEKRCEVCHTRAFGGVPDQACQQCHDGAAHPAKVIDTAHAATRLRCAVCHAEHRGRQRLSAVADVNCTGCHGQISAHSAGAKVRNVTAFTPDRHPEFGSVSQSDLRPLRLNHAVHMPAAAKKLRGMTLPMKCADCHVTDRTSATGALLPVSFERNCKNCHARELEFDVYHLLGSGTGPAPHAKDAMTIHEYVAGSYRQALAANPGLARRPLGTELVPAANAAMWLERVTRDSERYLFERKCGYCHQTAGGGAVRSVNLVAGRFVEGNPQGTPWLERGEFAHRSHRAVECEDCHTRARTSMKTEDVLVPGMKSCLGCHGESGSALDRCATCHLYHNRSLEKAPTHDRGPETRP
jgi:cytochrome c5